MTPRTATRISVWLFVAVLILVCLSSNLPCKAQGETVLPSELLPQPAGAHRVPNRFQLKLLKFLPAPFYLDADVEGSFRLETNPFQSPTKRVVLRQQLPLGTSLSDLAGPDLITLNTLIREADTFDQISRINPNVTAGWSVTPNTQVFANYFYLRDSLFHNPVLNSDTQAFGPGAQYTKTIGKRTSVQTQFSMREMWQTGQIPVFDYLPALTVQHTVTPNLTVYVNPLLQVRLKHFAGEPQRELDSFYTVGASYQRGSWSFSASGIFNQNIRRPFRGNALLPVNNYSVIADFEIDKQLSKKIPGLQAFVRAEPVWNFGSHNTNGLSGMDFRFFYGLRMSVSKPSLTAGMRELEKRYMSAPSLK